MHSTLKDMASPQHNSKVRSIPAKGRSRIRTLCGLNPSTLKRMRQAKQITQADYSHVIEAKKTAKPLFDAARLIGIRSVDIARWDKDKRFPHAYKTIVDDNGVKKSLRMWIMDDIDHASKNALGWIQHDIRVNSITASPSVQMMMDHIAHLPTGYLPSNAKQYTPEFMDNMAAECGKIWSEYANERAAEKDAAEQKKVQDQLDTEKRIAHILEMAGDRHWDTLFHNPQLGKRKLEAYLGPTNSGKTYNALQALQKLKRGESGVYLAPLRLLALEVCEELRSAGIPTSLITGEEQDIEPNAKVICSTIEMLDTTKVYNIAVIDEMQIVADQQRGWAWTRALFQLDADRIFILGSTAVEPMLRDFADSTGDDLDIHITSRFTPLQMIPNPVAPVSIQKGTLFSVFSRNSVIQWGQFFRNNGFSVAQIYGAMPPEVRREEARRFRSGEADILVATDAVSMGLNLPAHTVVIGEYEKYDGSSTTPVPHSLVRQIAGRAGRFGYHESGMVAGTDDIIHKHIKKAITSKDTHINFPHLTVAPTYEWVDMVMEDYPNTTVQDLLIGWEKTIEGSKWFTCIDMSTYMEKARVLDSVAGSSEISMHERLQILTAPVNVRTGQMDIFRKMISGIANNQKIDAPITPTGDMVITDELETAYKSISLYCWFHYRYPNIFPAIRQAETERSVCVSKLIEHIRLGLKRYCRACGAPLTTHKNVTMCRTCYTEFRRGY